MKLLPGIVLLVFLFLATAAGMAHADGQAHYRALAGTWLRPLDDGANQEGFHLEPDGRLFFVNIYSMYGSSWDYNEQGLTLWTATERYPIPQPVRYSVLAVSTSELDLQLEDGALTLNYHRPRYTSPLQTGCWRFTVLLSPKDSADKLQLEREALLQFHDETSLSGFAGCNTFRASYSRTGHKLSIGPVVTTRMTCPAMDYEEAVLYSLAQTKHWLIVENQLFLYDDLSPRATLEATN